MFVFSHIWVIQQSVSAWTRIISIRFLSVFTEWKEPAVYQCMDPDFFYSVLSVLLNGKNRQCVREMAHTLPESAQSGKMNMIIFLQNFF